MLKQKTIIMKTRINFRWSRTAVLLLFFIIPGLSGCQKASDNNTPGTGSNDVSIENMMFSPGTITVTANTTIKWTNNDGMTHTVTSNTGIFDSGNISAGGTYSHTFATAGTYPYHCTIHPAMIATVNVN